MDLFYAGGKFGFDTATPAEQVEVKKDQNAGTIILSTNATSGTAAYAGLKAANASGSIEMKALSAAFTTSGADIADTSQLKSTSVSGLILNLIGGSNDLSVYAGGAEVFNIAGSDGNLSIPSLQLTGGTGDQGKITWNADEETIDIILNGAVLQVGQEIHGHVKNMTGSTIANGTPVMFIGTQGITGRLLVAPITGTVQASAKFILGLVTYDILNNGEGKVTALGKVRDIDTTGGLSFGGLETWLDGDILWVDTANDGYLTNVEPSTGMGIGIGVVIRAHASLGSIYVRITPLDRHLYAELGTAVNFSSLILEGATSGTDTIQASAVASNTTYTWPAADGGANEGLITNGSGVLSWSAGGIAAAGSLTGATLAANVLTASLTTINGYKKGINVITPSTTPATDLALGNVHTLATGANNMVFAAPSNAGIGDEHIWIITKDATTTDRTISFNSAFVFETAVPVALIDTSEVLIFKGTVEASGTIRCHVMGQTGWDNYDGDGVDFTLSGSPGINVHFCRAVPKIHKNGVISLWFDYAIGFTSITTPTITWPGGFLFHPTESSTFTGFGAGPATGRAVQGSANQTISAAGATTLFRGNGEVFIDSWPNWGVPL